MDRHAQRASLMNTLNSLFRRGQSSSADEQVDLAQQAGVVYTQFQSSGPIQLDQGVEATSFSGLAASHSHAAEGDVPMHLAGLPNDTPYSTGRPAHTASSSPQLTSLPPTGAFTASSRQFDSEESEFAHHPIVDDDAHSDISMPPLEIESDLEYEEDHVRHGGYDSVSESDADAYDVEMTLLVDDGDQSDDEGSALLTESTPQLPPTSSAADRNLQHVTVEEVEDQDQQPDSTPLAGSGQPGSSHSETHSHRHPHPHPHPPHPHPHFHIHPHPLQHPHIPHPPHPDGDVRLPNFQGMPGLRAQGQVEGQVPLPGLRTLFQPLIVEAIAQASERFRAAQGTGGPATGQGPTMGPTGPAPIVQVTFDVPVFRVPTVGQTRQHPQPEARPGMDGQRQAEHERAFAAPPSAGPMNLNSTPPTPNPIPNATDAMPPVLRQIFEATFDPDPADPPTGDGPQIGPPGWTGLMGLLFGLGLGASHELNREDPARARRLVKGLEAVNTGLVKRMGKIGNADGAICAICWDALLEGDVDIAPDSVAEEPLGDVTSNRGQSNHPEAETTDSAEQEQEPEPEEPLPKVIALPCSHVFHSGCLVPWFSRPKQTTCPTCRFNVDPENLTYEPPRRPQGNTPQQPQERPMSPQPEAPQQGEQGGPGEVPPLQQTPQQQDGHPQHPPLRRTVFEHTFTIPFSPPLFPLAHPLPGNPVPQPPPEMRQQGPGQQGPFPAPAATVDHFSPIAFQRAFHNLRRPLTPHFQPHMHPLPNGALPQDGFAPPQVPLQPQTQAPLPNGASQEGSALPQVPLQPQAQPPLPDQGMPPPGDGQPNVNGMPRFPGLFQFQLPQFPLQPQAQPPLPDQGMPPPPGDGQQNMNGMPRFPGLFQFQLPQIVRMPDGTWFWSASAPLGGFPPPASASAPQAPGPAAPKRAWVPPPPPGLTLRQRVEQGEREKGLRCDDMSCGVGPSDDDPEPTADVARVVIHSQGDGASVCGHTFHSACLVSAERVAGWGPDSESERERAGGMVEVSCPVCRAVGVVPQKEWEQGAQALA